jgi:hypothetical protein
MLAAAYVAFGQGQVERCDSLFRAAIPRLDPGLAPLFRDPSRLLGDEAPAGGLKGLDPDPTTPENEVELEYWSRVAHAFLLFYDHDRGGVDARFQTYVQYGPPTATATNPEGTPLYFRTFATSTMPSQGRESEEGGNPGRPPMDFPTPIQLWAYPELGMRVVLQDRSLHGRFQPRATMDFDPASRPDPGILAARGDLIGFPGGVFHRLPPREQRIETRGVLARFTGARGPSVMAQVEVAGTPADSMLARFLVTDASGRAVARGAGALGIDACDPAGRRRGQFIADLRPGIYDVTVSVRGGDGKRGMFRSRATVEPGDGGLALSDLVLACGDPSLLIGGGSARFDANVEARVTGRSLAGYVEIYGLSPGPDGLARFESVCRVRRAIPESRRGRRRDDRAVLVSTSREESQPGSMRRQFVLVPIASLPAGTYELEVSVRDQTSGAVSTRAVTFVRE